MYKRPLYSQTLTHRRRPQCWGWWSSCRQLWRKCGPTAWQPTGTSLPPSLLPSLPPSLPPPFPVFQLRNIEGLESARTLNSLLTPSFPPSLPPSLPPTRRIKKLLLDESRAFVFFANEHHAETYR